MFKPVHGLAGTLQADITAFSTAVQLDDDATCLLKKRVPSGDYTYLLIRAAYDYEIVKMIGVAGNMATIVRGQDGTTAQAFTEGSSVEFVLSEQALSDIVNDKALGQIQISGGGMVTVTEVGPNNFTISAPAINITSSSPDILVGGVFPNFVISAPEKAACCD